LILKISIFYSFLNLQGFENIKFIKQLLKTILIKKLSFGYSNRLGNLKALIFVEIRKDFSPV